MEWVELLLDVENRLSLPLTTAQCLCVEVWVWRVVSYARCLIAQYCTIECLEHKSEGEEGHEFGHVLLVCMVPRIYSLTLAAVWLESCGIAWTFTPCAVALQSE